VRVTFLLLSFSCKSIVLFVLTTGSNYSCNSNSRRLNGRLCLSGMPLQKLTVGDGAEKVDMILFHEKEERNQ